MNLLLVSQDFPPKTGGIETYSFELAKQWVGLVDKLVVLTASQPTREQKEEAFDANCSFKVYRVSVTDPSVLPFQMKKKLAEVIISENITHSFHAQWQTALPALSAKNAGNLEGVFVAVHGRELLFNPFGKMPLLRKWYRSRMRYALGYADAIFANSQYTAGLLPSINTRRMPPLYVTGLGVDATKYSDVNREQSKQWLQQQLGRKIEMPVILSLTRLVARKGVDDTLRACAMLRKQYPDLSFIYCIAGSGPDQDRLKKLVEELDLDNLVYFLGRVEDSDLSMLYGSADIFCMPSRKDGPDVEGFGIVFLEAAAAGVPSIGSRSGGIPDAIKDQKTGLLVPEKNIEALANALHTLLVDEAYRHQLSQEAKQYVATMNWERIGTDIYERMKSYA